MKRLTLVVLVLCWGTIAAAQTATYTYNPGGLTFDDVNGAYDTSMTVTGWFRTSTVLPPTSSRVDISSLVEAYSFSDGIQTLTQDNSYIAFFSVQSGPGGVPAEWSIAIYRDAGVVIDGIDLAYTDESDIPAGSVVQLDGFQGAACGAGTPDDCRSTVPTTAPDYGSYLRFDPLLPLPRPGAWSVAAATVPDVPATSTVTLMILALIIAVAGAMVLRGA